MIPTIIDNSDAFAHWSGWETKTGKKEIYINPSLAGHGKLKLFGKHIEFLDPDTSFPGTGPNDRMTSTTLNVVAAGADRNKKLIRSAKDFCAVTATAAARTKGWPARGTSGICANALQYGIGVGTNELTAHNPSNHDQAYELQAVMGIVRPDKAAWNFGGQRKIYNSFSALNSGQFGARSGLQITSYPGSYHWGIDMYHANIKGSGIRLNPTLPGSVIGYGANIYTFFNHVNKNYFWIIDGKCVARLGPKGLYIPTWARQKNDIEKRLTALEKKIEESTL